MSIILLYLKIGIYERLRIQKNNKDHYCKNFHVGVEYRHFGQNPRSNKQKSNCCEKKLVKQWCTSLPLNKEFDKFSQELWIGLNEALRCILALGSFLFVSFLLVWFFTEIKSVIIAVLLFSPIFTKLMFLSIFIISNNEFRELLNPILKTMIYGLQFTYKIFLAMLKFGKNIGYQLICGFDECLNNDENNSSVCLFLRLTIQRLMLRRIQKRFVVPFEDLNVDSEIMTENKLPEHEWLPEEKANKKFYSKLAIGPYIFGRKQDRPLGGLVQYRCLGCANLKQGNTYAKARKVSVDENGKPTYVLEQAPKSEDHQCAPSSMNRKIQDFIPLCKRLIRGDQFETIGNIYKLARAQTKKGMTALQEIDFNAQSTSLENCNSQLYKYRSSFYPPDPKTSVSSLFSLHITVTNQRSNYQYVRNVSSSFH